MENEYVRVLEELKVDSYLKEMKQEKEKDNFGKIASRERIKSANNVIESYQEVTFEELNILDKFKDNAFFDVRVKVIYSIDKMKRIKEKLDNILQKWPILRNTYPKTKDGKIVKAVLKKEILKFTISKVEGEKETQKLQRVKNCISQEENRKYNPNNNTIFRGQILQFNDDTYIFILSMAQIFKDIYTIDMLMEDLFGSNDSVVRVGMKEENQENSRIALVHWKNVLERETGKYQRVEKINSGNGSKETLTLVIPEKIQKVLIQVGEKKRKEIETFFILACGKIVGHYHMLSKLKLGYVKDNCQMSILPIVIDNELQLKDLFVDIYKQVKTGEKNVSCYLDQVKQVCNLDTQKDLPIRVRFSDFDDLEMALEMREEKILLFSDIGSNDASLLINFRLSNDCMNMKYIYDTKIAEDYQIRKMHERMCEIVMQLTSLLTGEQENTKLQTEVIGSEQEKEEYYKLQIAYKALYAKKTNVFDKLNTQELLKLGADSSLEIYLNQEIVYNEQEIIKNIYIVAEGKVEATKANGEGYMQPLMVLKEGDVFGMESLLEAPFANASYRAYHDIVKIVRIPIEVIMEWLHDKPELWQALFENQNNTLLRFEKLWIMG